ncbi:phage infection protein [Rhodococcus sp. 14-2470-1a]|uniref:phage infection protein n=1 Tax=Rhodococcus sp. 14-2470-1a TaxID=2023150 RepID=UPI000B9B3E2D|nr:phage infection protein [Rhodococcus sp. 14-2470-1a]OZF49765.1 phage infection protein [Rhodococcus sp. 14-2470-1a]
MGKFSFTRRPSVALLAIAFPLVAAGSFALGAGVDLTADTQPTTAASTAEAPTETPTGDPLATSRKNLQEAGLPVSFLSAGVSQLTDGGNQLNDGVVQLTDGITQAHDGTVQLADGFVEYRAGIGQLGDGASQISGGVDEVVDTLAGFGAQQAQFTASLEAAAQQVDAFPHPGSDGISGQIRGVIDTLNTQGFGPDTLDQLQTLKAGARQLSGELNDPSSQFLSATSQIGDATVQLRDGLGQLDDGGGQLRAGTDQLVTAVEPVSGIVSGIQTNVQEATAGLPTAKQLNSGELNSGNAAASDDSTDVAAASGTSGSTTSVAPYLIAALVAVGAVGAVSLVRVLSRDSRLRWVAAAVAVAAVGACAALAFAFTAPDASIGALIGAGAFLVVSAGAYLAAAGAIQRVLGSTVGQAVNVVLLVVQVVVCGAASASSAAIWGHLSAFMPMAYTAAGAREIGYSSMTSTGWLALVLTAALLVVSGVVYRTSSRTEGRAAELPNHA